MMHNLNQNFFKKSHKEKFSQSKTVLLPLLDALKWHGSYHRLNESLAVISKEFSDEDLIETLSNLKFKHFEIHNVKGHKISQLWLPLLIVNKENHLLVLKIDGDYALVFDGNDGLYKKVHLNKLKGKGHYFQSSNGLVETVKGNWFNNLIYRFRTSIIQIAFLTFAITALDLLIPLFVILIYSQIAQVSALDTLLTVTMGIVIYLISAFMLGQMRSNIIDYISARMGSIISTETYTRLLYLNPSYTETASVNAQINRIKDFENLKRFITGGFFLNFLDLIFSSLYLIVIFAIGGWLVYIPIITFVIVFFTGLIMRPFHKLKMESLSESSNLKQQQLIEILKNAEKIRTSNAKSFLINKFKMLNARQIYSRFELSDFINFSNTVSYFICNASVLVFIYGGVILVFNNHMTMGALIGLLMLYWKVLASIRGSFNLSVQVNGLVKSINQINRFMNLPQDTQPDDQKKPVKPMKGNVIFKDVSLKYNSLSNPALVNINFDIKSGEIVGLQGHDGSGKSSILKLILGMYKPQVGRILLDNVNIRQLEPISLRQSISYATADDSIFTGTIRENFMNYNPNLTDEEILKWAEKTGLSDYFKKLGFDLDTVFEAQIIGELSLSFKKIFNITRMFCRNVKLYLLDEPENHLNQMEINRIMSLVKKTAIEENATMIISTKVESVSAYCDRVIVLNEGRILSQKINEEV